MLKKNSIEQLKQQFIQSSAEILPIGSILSSQPENDYIVCVGDGYQYYWSDLLVNTQAIIKQLQQHPQHIRVALVFRSGFLMVCALLASYHSQRKIILPALHTLEYLSDIQQDFDLLLSDNATLCEQVANKNDSCFCPIIENSNVAIEFIPPVSLLESENSQLYLFSSGSTGEPKKIEKSFYVFDREVQLIYDLFKEKLKGSIVFSTVNHNHFFGFIYRLFIPLALRVPFWDFTLTIPEQLTKINYPYTLVSSPAFLRFLTSDLNYSPARTIYSAGGKLPKEVCQNAEKVLNGQVMEIYGSSETGTIAYKSNAESYWHPCTGIQIRQNTLTQCLELLSPIVSPQLLSEDLWYRTEDRISLVDNSFELLGRVDQVVKIADKRISLTQIENLALGLKEIKEIKCLVIPQEKRDIVAAVVVLSKETPSIENKVLLALLRQHLKNHIETVGFPRKIRIVEFMPLSEQGKLNIKQLRSLFV